MLGNIDSIYKQFKVTISGAENCKIVEDIRVKFLGKNGLITIEAKKIAALPNEIKKEFGQKINEVKQLVIKELEEVQTRLADEALDFKLRQECIDVTLPGRGYKRGRIHPITHTIRLIKDIFRSMGFEHVAGPEIDNEWNNFSALNISENHPARQMHDTFYLEEDKLLLRTHTSTVQVRHMMENKPPLRIFSTGKVYRSDYDATHTPMFHQVECLVVDEKSSVQDLHACLETFLRLFFKTDNIAMRFRASYFPFTEPSFEVDIRCDRSIKGEIKIGTGNDWLEILGSGMVNKRVLHNVGIDPEKYQGFAFGIGIERLAMLKYNIPDLRSCFEGDVRWLNHYGF
ncbi:phenylalanine--tRNA ligase subunit alpha [Candidatus Bandiella euplotis]|uniref:Phenylalanine--tRNA ligase alpha subunit n=1 Tax=Candidatus Bandiella euplotis TaxID=1664265 RepID=A0ABZ0UL67_9RICK|nr:phenylalanine--tRNA ligase subunit alpha [Candidatus Bandiella woodruffii]WPX96879.1 Phenylalanine--tRNA ligase alpha subunit [Candidatus Bandiella woodruffii]